MKKTILAWTFGLLAVLAQAAPARGIGPDNPAGAALKNGVFELELIGISAGFWNNLFSLGNINADLTDPVVKEDFLAVMEGGWYKAGFQGATRLGLSIGDFGLQLRPWTSGSILLAPGFGQAVFNGMEPGGTCDLTGSGANGLAALSVDLSGAYPFRLGDSTLAVGVVAHYLLGLAMFDAKITNGRVQIDEYGNIDYRAELQIHSAYNENTPLAYEPLGEGYLVDLGLIYDRGPFQLGAVIKNIGPGMTWNAATKQRAFVYGEVTAGPDGPEHTYVYDDTSSPAEIAAYSHAVPMVVGLYGTYKPYERLELSAGYEQGLDEGWGVSRTPRLWAGGSWNPLGFVILAGEASFQGNQFTYAIRGELHLFFVWLSAEISTIGGFGEDSTGLSGTVGLKLHF